MDIKNRTFAGKRFTKTQLALVQDTVQTFSNLSLRELGHTICEHLNWRTPKGEYKIQSCLTALEQMQDAGLVALPKKRARKKTKQKATTWTEHTCEQAPISCDLKELYPISIRPVTDPEDSSLWNEYVDRYHYLNYRRPVASYIKYFITSGSGNEEIILGCLLFSLSGSRSLQDRDKWIGWTDHQRKNQLNLVLTNNRFLIFPWVHIKNLASKVLSIVSKQIGDDWIDVHGYRPVLLETFVDPEKYLGSCYQAANWQKVGYSSGRPRDAAMGDDLKRSPKEIYLFPLEHQFREILQGKPKKSTPKKRSPSTYNIEPKDPFMRLWQKIVDVALSVSRDCDEKWQKRKRLIDTMLIILFVFRLVFSKNTQGYQATINELWDQCKRQDYPLPQSKPPSASSMHNARLKVDEMVFKELNTKIIAHYHDDTSKHYQWRGHHVFGVDGSKINLPRKLMSEGYNTPSPNAAYPQGLVSTLYHLKSKVPYDFFLVKHNRERELALAHLNVLHPNDLVVYDRGYYSYEMLYYHLQKGVHAVFRIKTKAHRTIDEFIASDYSDQVVTINLTPQSYKKLRQKSLKIKPVPLQLRLVKYSHSNTTFILGTTLLDQEVYPTDCFSDLYHSRWGIEEMYKISKALIDVEDFHSKKSRGIKQELFAHFVLITVNRLFANHMDEFINEEGQGPSKGSAEKTQVNFKNVLITLARHLEGLFIQQLNLVHITIQNVFKSIALCKQKTRPNRSYARVSMKPIGKWRPPKEARAKA